VVQSCDHLGPLLDSFDAMVVCLDSTGRVTFANALFLQATGFTRDEVIGADYCVTFLSGDPQREISRLHQEMFNKLRRSSKAVYSIATRGGERRQFLWKSVALLDDQGNPAGIACHGTPINESGSIAGVPRSGEDPVRLLFEQTSDIVIIHDMNGSILEVNPAACKRLGTSRSELLSQRRTDIERPPLPGSQPEWEEEIRRRGQVHYESVYLRRDGLGLPVSVKCFRIEYRNRPALLCLARDLTERHRAQKALAQSRNSLNRIVENSTNGILVVDARGEILYANPAAAELFGRKSGAELAGRPFGFPATPGNATEIEVFRSSGNPGIAEMRMIQNDWHGAPAHLVMLRDITLRKQIEEERARAQKLESLGVLAGGIAHDFNNMLTGVVANISLAKTVIEPGHPVHRILDEAEKASSRARELTQQLLTFAKGGAPVRTPIAIQVLLEETAQFALSGSRSRIRFHLPEDLWPVEVDTNQISQAITNLVINADQAMPKGGNITLRGENVDLEHDPDARTPSLKKGRYVRITLQDEGVGIPRSHLPRIFDPYFTTKQKSSGLGLATTHSIILSHGGHIDVSAELGKGTTFHLYLPASSRTATRPQNQENQPLQGSGRVLIMDDDEMIRDLLLSALGHLGYEAEAVVDGGEALRVYEEGARQGKPFQAVIMDLTIPGGLGGKETIQRLLEIDPKAKAIVSSGYSDDAVMAEYRQHGFRGILGKPFDLNELARILHEIMTEAP
jgi:PAS domain S-box-containing protein